MPSLEDHRRQRFPQRDYFFNDAAYVAGGGTSAFRLGMALLESRLVCQKGFVSTPQSPSVAD